MRERAGVRCLPWGAVGGAVVFTAVQSSAIAARPEPELDLRAACEALPAPGRVRCELELRAPSGARLAWSDVLVVSAPSAARPLRSRLAAPPGPDGVGRATVAVIASTTGAFPVVIRGRAVVCDGPSEEARCQPITRERRIEVRVGG